MPRNCGWVQKQHVSSLATRVERSYLSKSTQCPHREQSDGLLAMLVRVWHRQPKCASFVPDNYESRLMH